jgi:hypothetical protein
MKCSRSYTFLQVKFRVRLQNLSGRWKIKIIYESENTRQSRTAPCPRDVNLRNGSHRKGERESTLAKQYQDKARATKVQQYLPINVVINSQLLICKA